MNANVTEDQLLADLRQACFEYFHLDFTSAEPLDKGWLNRKWKAIAREGVFVLKQFSKERYRDRDLTPQHVALLEQLRQHQRGIPCPRVFTFDGNALLVSPSGERFVLMEFCPGRNLRPGTLNDTQMFDLGRITGNLHTSFNDGTYSPMAAPHFVPPSREERIGHWRTLAEQATENRTLLDMVAWQLKATEQMDLGWLADCEPGWAHRDLFVDNILFAGDEVSAILDFDRFAYNYPELDVARAILSGALQGGQLNVAAARAFLEGYRTERSFKKGTLLRALRMAWYMESVWWIRMNMDTREAPVRFAAEMMWLARNMERLPSLVGQL
ncbi:MAG: phosphotransferase [Alicyclobacillus sp.]|nr:phosphotransferase [Alicyclobacillus sp.]